MMGTDRNRWRSDAIKRAIDLIGSLAMLILVAPLLALVAVAIWITMGPPILFRQQRSGRHNRQFQIVKFRTMRPTEGIPHPDDDEARLTTLGRFLRATSLDELPTLLNVLAGDMSLVGPRPLPVRYEARYTPLQARRHEVRPGITGWTQIRGRNTLSWEQKFELDLWYVEHRSLGVDLKILLATVGAVMRRSGISRDGHATMPEFEGTDGPE